MREHWTSRLGFVLAALGSAIGLGTLWKFPYVTGDNGGGIFLFFYLLFTLFLGIPLFIGELLLGRRAQRGAVGVFAQLSGESSAWRTVGWLGVASSFLILSYYCVVAGWGLNYLMLSLNQVYELRTSAEISNIFDTLYRSGDINLFWAFIFLLMTFGVVYQGVRKGIELWSRVLTIALLILLLLLCAYAFTLDGIGRAIHFLFEPNTQTIQPSGIIEALGLSLFTLSLAQGIILTYGSYLKSSEDLPKTALIIGLMVVFVGLLTVLTIFPVIFTFDLPPHGGAGLIFQTLPLLFDSLPGSMVISTLFFTLFVFTALTSAMALLEVIVANLIDLYQWSRKKAVLYSTLAAFIVGIPSALAGSQDLFKEWLPMYGENFFNTIDNLVSVWLLPLGGFFTALYLGWRLKKELVREEFLRGTTFGSIFTVWYFLIRWLVPLAVIVIFLQRAGFIDLDKLL
ncbi:MAG: sodium-dependent transporter [Chlamydiales bacterium]|nr:sodium-dependent transporter [Chlamydiales bacterium]